PLVTGVQTCALPILQHEGGPGIDEAVAEAVPELLVVGEVDVVAQADEALHGQERVLVEEAQPGVVDDREDDETAQQHEGGGEEEPPGERALPHSPRSPAALTTSACGRAALAAPRPVSARRP